MATKTTKIDTIVIGAGQAGLAMSYYLSLAGKEHLLLERGEQAGSVWRNERWDSFTYVTPNWAMGLPGAEYRGAYPDGFMPRREIVEYFQRYAAEFQLPIRYNTRFLDVEEDSSGEGFLVHTDAEVFTARNVVVAAGFFQTPKIPALAANLPESIVQLHSSGYRNPQSLPPGAVLVVGTGQSGSQIAEELYQSGRTVYLSTGKSGRVPRRYRGKDAWEWLNRIGFLDRPVESLSSPKERFIPIPHLSGTKGGHTINLHQFARDGVHLLGHVEDFRDGKLKIAPNLMENLAFADRFEAETMKRIDAWIAKTGNDAPPQSIPTLVDGFETPIVTELDLGEAGIQSVIWATGYRFDFHWVKPAALDEDGFPILQRGVAPCPGLYFIGLPWQNVLKSGLIAGLADTAKHILEKIEERSAVFNDAMRE